MSLVKYPRPRQQRSSDVHSCSTTYILHLTYSVCQRKVLVDRVWLTLFSAPLESTRSPEVNSHQPRSTSATGASMKTFYAMRRANGDWFAVADKGDLRMPIFKNSGD